MTKDETTIFILSHCYVTFRNLNRLAFRYKISNWTNQLL